MTRGRLLVIGVGNDSRGDDGIGLALVRELDSRVRPDDVDIVPHTGDGMALIALWDGYESVLIVDAMRGGGQPGETAVFDATDGDIPQSALAGLSSHGLGLAEAVEMARALGKLPADIRVLGIEARDMSDSSSFSPEIEARLPYLRSTLISLISPMNDE